MPEAITDIFREYQALILLYAPLGALGLWRWGTWLFKQFCALFYQPATEPFRASVSVVTPVYNEDPDVFAAALRSWQSNSPEEIIAVIDTSDTRSLAVFQSFAREHTRARLLVTSVPGKRPALVEGIRAAQCEIVALVDSDTLWDPTLLRHALPPFRDRAVGGVATQQSVWRPRTIAQKLFDIQLSLRYFDEMPFLAAVGSTLRCLSGRTALYRRSAILPCLGDLLLETYWGVPAISGEDKRLTYLIQSAGWKSAYQQSARVYTQGAARLSQLMRQRLRWSRNTWRADLRALRQRWLWRRPLFAWYLLDNALQPFVSLFSPLYLVVSLVLGLWVPALLVIGGWHATRFVKLSIHFVRRPVDVALLPLFIGFSFLTSLVKVYALFSLSTQGWITRWDQARLAREGILQRLLPTVATALTLVLVTGGVLVYKQRVVPHAVFRWTAVAGPR